MNRPLIGVLLLSGLAACDREADTAAPTPSVQAASARTLGDRLLTGLDARTQWSTRHVKINLSGPWITASFVDPEGKNVLVHAWPKTQNDFNVPMMRLDGGAVLYAMTDAEWEELGRQ